MPDDLMKLASAFTSDHLTGDRLSHPWPAGPRTRVCSLAALLLDHPSSEAHR
jgi:hypothetical protein